MDQSCAHESLIKYIQIRSVQRSLFCDQRQVWLAARFGLACIHSISPRLNPLIISPLYTCIHENVCFAFPQDDKFPLINIRLETNDHNRRLSVVTVCEIVATISRCIQADIHINLNHCRMEFGTLPTTVIMSLHNLSSTNRWHFAYGVINRFARS